MDKKQIEEILLSKGIRINIGACGCCDSPWVSLEVDGELLVNEEDDFKIEMIK